MGDSFGYFSEQIILHVLLAHEVYVFAGAVVIDMVEAMRVCEPSFGHSEAFGFVIHVLHKLLIVVIYAIRVLGKIDTSNF